MRKALLFGMLLWASWITAQPTDTPTPTATPTALPVYPTQTPTYPTYIDWGRRYVTDWESQFTTVVDEAHKIPAGTVRVGLNMYPSDDAAYNFTVRTAPGGGGDEYLRISEGALQTEEYAVDYDFATVQFHSSNVGTTVYISYTGLKSPIWAVDMNKLTLNQLGLMDYLDNLGDLYVLKAGDTMTGTLVMDVPPGNAIEIGDPALLWLTHDGGLTSLDGPIRLEASTGTPPLLYLDPLRATFETKWDEDDLKIIEVVESGFPWIGDYYLYLGDDFTVRFDGTTDISGDVSIGGTNGLAPAIDLDIRYSSAVLSNTLYPNIRLFNENPTGASVVGLELIADNGVFYSGLFADGNGSLTGGTPGLFMRTFSAHSIFLATGGNTRRLVVDPGGNVGIGPSLSPSSLLHVQGTARFDGDGSNYATLDGNGLDFTGDVSGNNYNFLDLSAITGGGSLDRILWLNNENYWDFLGKLNATEVWTGDVNFSNSATSWADWDDGDLSLIDFTNVSGTADANDHLIEADTWEADSEGLQDWTVDFSTGSKRVFDFTGCTGITSDDWLVFGGDGGGLLDRDFGMRGDGWLQVAAVYPVIDGGGVIGGDVARFDKGSFSNFEISTRLEAPPLIVPDGSGDNIRISVENEATATVEIGSDSQAEYASFSQLGLLSWPTHAAENTVAVLDVDDLRIMGSGRLETDDLTVIEFRNFTGCAKAVGYEYTIDADQDVSTELSSVPLTVMGSAIHIDKLYLEIVTSRAADYVDTIEIRSKQLGSPGYIVEWGPTTINLGSGNTGLQQWQTSGLDIDPAGYWWIHTENVCGSPTAQSIQYHRVAAAYFTQDLGIQ